MQQSLGSTTRDAHIRHAIESFRRQGRHGEADKLEAETEKLVPDPPPEGEYLWDIFIEITSSRRVADGTPTTSITQELDLWQRLYSMQFKPWEIRALRMLDGVWCNWLVKQQSKKSSNNG